MPQQHLPMHGATLSARMPLELYAQVLLYAEQQRIPVSAAARELLTAGLEQHLKRQVVGPSFRQERALRQADELDRLGLDVDELA